jgi:hypothetical protein
MNDKLDGRRIHHWRGRDRTTDVARLADAIATAIELYNHDGALVRLGDDGQLINVNRADLHELISRHICGIKITSHNGILKKEYFTYEFAPPRRHDATLSGPRPPPDNSLPDANVLDELYRHELVWRLPKVEA